MAFQRWVTSRKVWRAQRRKQTVLDGMAAWDGAMRRVRSVQWRERRQDARPAYHASAARWRRAERALRRYEASVRGAVVQAWIQEGESDDPRHLLRLVHAYNNDRLRFPRTWSIKVENDLLLRSL